MINAIEAVRSKTMGYKRAAILFGVPRTTLCRLTRKHELTPEDAASLKLGRKPYLPASKVDDFISL